MSALPSCPRCGYRMRLAQDGWAKCNDCDFLISPEKLNNPSTGDAMPHQQLPLEPAATAEDWEAAEARMLAEIDQMERPCLQAVELHQATKDGLAALERARRAVR